MAQKTATLTTTKASGGSYTSTLPTSSRTTSPSAFDTSSQSVVDQQIMMKCGVIREFPNPQMATYLGDKLAQWAKNREASAQKEKSVADTIGMVDDFAWEILGIVAEKSLDGIKGEVASVAIDWLSQVATSQVDQWISDLAMEIESGYISTAQLNAIALISGEPSMLNDVRMGVGSIPQNQLIPYLDNILQKQEDYKGMIKSIPTWMFDGNVLLQIAVYFNLAMIQYTIKYICDTLMGVTPMVSTTVLVSVAPVGSKIPKEASWNVKGDGTSNKGSILPLLLTIGAGFLLL